MTQTNSSLIGFKRLAKKNKFSFFQLISLDRLKINKRQKFVIAIVILSCGLFISENFLGKSNFLISLLLAFFTDVFLFWTNHKDIRENPSLQNFILPFFYSLSFGLFYFLVPNRLMTRLIVTSLYAVGLYSLFLSQNIFTVASIRTIALLSSARTVSFILTLISYFFLANVVITLDLPVVSTVILVFIFSYFLISHSIWSYTLEKSFFSQSLWVLGLSIVLTEFSSILWFWPSTPTIIALFLAGFFYTIVGISHVWFEKRLFKGVLWEYIWVGVVVSCLLILFTTWKG